MSHERQQISSRSINSIIRAHPRERLLVRPPLWTSRHLELLNVEWKPPQKCETDHDHAEPIAPSPLSPSSGNDGGPRLTKGRVDVRSLADQAMRLATTIYGGVKDWTIINLLNNMDNPGHLDRWASYSSRRATINQQMQGEPQVPVCRTSRGPSPLPRILCSSRKHHNQVSNSISRLQSSSIATPPTVPASL